MSLPKPSGLGPGGMPANPMASPAHTRRARFVPGNFSSPSQRVTRMKWLYNTITAYGTEYEFSEAAREWIKERVATSDVSSRRDRRLSTWWEDSNKKTPSGGSGGGVKPFSATSFGSPLRSAVSAPGPATAATAPTAAADIPKLSLSDVLGSSSLLSDVKDALEDNYGAHNLEFLEAVQSWRDDLEELGADSSKRDTLLYDGAVSIYSQFVDRATARDNLITVPDDIVTMLIATMALIIKRGKGKVEASLLNPSFFDEAVAAVTRYVEDNLWPDFIASDEYTQLCIAQAETASRPAASSAASRAALKPLPASRFDYLDTAPRVPYPLANGPRPPQWSNADTRYASITVTVSSGRGPMASMRGNNQLYALVASGSRILRGSPQPCLWGETFSLPIYDTTQCVTVAICHGTRLIGYLPLDLAEIARRPDVAAPLWFPLRGGESAPEPGASTPPVGPAVPVGGPAGAGLVPSDSAGSAGASAAAAAAAAAAAGSTGNPGVGTEQASVPSGKNEVLLQWSLTQEEAVPVALQPEYVKTLYADETSSGGLGAFIRGKVSKKKKRFNDDNFDLDLTYITPQVIAMGFPSEGTEGVYRNPIKQVQQFFALRHPNAFRIYNLCSERAYEPSKFNDCVMRFPFDDHNPPPFTLIKEFCEDARQFLSASPQNVVSIHCKAGKGRTGTMIACLFVYLGMATSAEALSLFGQKRTSNAKGVTIPSQIRYVHYFDTYCSLRRAGRPAPGRTTLFLQRVLLRNVGKSYSAAEVFFTVLEPNQGDEDVGDAAKQKLYSSRKLVDPVYYLNTDSLCWDLSKKLIDVSEDLRVEFAAKTGFGREKMLQCWLNTRFLKLDTSAGYPRVVVPKRELDKACKDTGNKRFPANMYLELVFSSTATATLIKESELAVSTSGASAAAATGASLAPGAAARASSSSGGGGVGGAGRSEWATEAIEPTR